MSRFCERFKELLEYNKISQNAFAKISMSQSVINNYCTGRREPSLDVLISICNELNVSADYLLGRTDLTNY
ncbi:MAG: helix-turn-helix transcriptional regulator [Clostridia bacterium]|nr:helix-turn-helix transcriptional regulator [Clostridia bacterium]